MRGASDSKLNGDSGEGKVNELAVTTASICSTDDCIILARVFSSAKASCDREPFEEDALKQSSIEVRYRTDIAGEGWVVDVWDGD
jgi:hypothetical protein